jgi:hypothetical protein
MVVAGIVLHDPDAAFARRQAPVDAAVDAADHGPIPPSSSPQPGKHTLRVATSSGVLRFAFGSELDDLDAFRYPSGPGVTEGVGSVLEGGVGSVLEGGLGGLGGGPSASPEGAVAAGFPTTLVGFRTAAGPGGPSLALTGTVANLNEALRGLVLVAGDAEDDDTLDDALDATITVRDILFPFSGEAGWRAGRTEAGPVATGWAFRML